jgi:hypothetical protein
MDLRNNGLSPVNGAYCGAIHAGISDIYRSAVASCFAGPTTAAMLWAGGA